MFYIATIIGSLTLQLFGTRWLIQRLGAVVWRRCSRRCCSPDHRDDRGAGFASATALGCGIRLHDCPLHKSASELFYFPLVARAASPREDVNEAGVERVGDAIRRLLISARRRRSVQRHVRSLTSSPV
jgi:hypothetical protein